MQKIHLICLLVHVHMWAPGAWAPAGYRGGVWAPRRPRPRCAMLWSADAHQGQYSVQIVVVLPRVLSLLSLLWCGHGMSRLPALLLQLERGCARLLLVVW